jgi:glycosyltransferase involved in cell wall biosynthesis
VGTPDAVGVAAIAPPFPAVSLFLMVNTFETGGSERQFAVLAKNLDISKFHLHLGCVSHRGSLADQFDSVPQFPLGGSLFGWRSLCSRLKLQSHLRKGAVEVAHAFDFYANLTLVPAARLARVPVVIGSHRQLGDLMTSTQFRAQAAVFRWCDMVVCNSHAAAGRLTASGIPGRKITVIGNALPNAAFDPVVPVLPRRAGLLRVGMVARMNAHYKNHAGFLRIAAAVHKSLPEAEFVLVGDGPLRPELEQQAAALEMLDRIVFLGDRRDVPAVLASLDVAILTSDSESLSNVILEAMAAQLPVIAYDVGGNGELINDQRGALIARGDENEFAAAIVRILSDTGLRRQLGENSRQFVERNFGLDHIRSCYEDLYLTLLDQKGRRR